MRFDLPFFKKKESKQVYFCLYLTDIFLNGFVLDFSSGKPIITAHKKNPLQSSDDPEKVLEETDILISDLEQQAKVQLDKTIFFLHSYMIDTVSHEIKDPYKVTIKTLVKDLELEPLGYIDLQEALSDHVKEKSIINSIFVEINKKELGIFIYKGGTLVHFEYTPRSSQIGQDIEAVLTNIPGKQILPTKVFLYGELEGAEDLASDISSYKWGEKTFIQHPIIDVIKEPEMNALLADSFSKELLDTSKVQDTQEKQQEEDAVVETNSFGFVFGSEVSADAKPAPTFSEVKRPTSTHAKSTAKAMKLPPFLKNIRFPFKFGNKKNLFPLVLPLVFLGTLACVFLVYEYSIYKAVVTVYPETKSFSDDIELNLPIEDSQPGDKLVLLKHTKVLDYNQEKSTSGSRDVGEKAKGEVTLHNFDNVEKSFDKGTKLVYKDMTFVTNTDVKVASSSGVTSDGTKQSGKTKVAVTASEIGDTYNIAKGAQMKIDGLSDSLYLAITDDAFTGGSRKKVKTVSKDDITALENSAEKESKKKSNQVIAKDLTKDEVLLSELTDVALAESTFSKELGEEADKVSIKASAEIDYYTVDKTMLNKTIQKNVTDSDSKEYVLDTKTLDIRVRDVEKEKNDASLKVGVDAKLNKKIDSEKIKKAIKGKSENSLSNLDLDIFNVKDIEIKSLFPNIPLLKNWLPLFAKNITIEVGSK